MLKIDWIFTKHNSKILLSVHLNALEKSACANVHLHPLWFSVKYNILIYLNSILTRGISTKSPRFVKLQEAKPKLIAAQ